MTYRLFNDNISLILIKEVKHMTNSTFKNSSIWKNIGEVTAQDGKMTLYVYKSVQFTANSVLSPRKKIEKS